MSSERSQNMERSWPDATCLHLKVVIVIHGYSLRSLPPMWWALYASLYTTNMCAFNILYDAISRCQQVSAPYRATSRVGLRSNQGDDSHNKYGDLSYITGNLFTNIRNTSFPITLTNLSSIVRLLQPHLSTYRWGRLDILYRYSGYHKFRWKIVRRTWV